MTREALRDENGGFMRDHDTVGYMDEIRIVLNVERAEVGGGQIGDSSLLFGDVQLPRYSSTQHSQNNER